MKMRRKKKALYFLAFRCNAGIRLAHLSKTLGTKHLAINLALEATLQDGVYQTAGYLRAEAYLRATREQFAAKAAKAMSRVGQIQDGSGRLLRFFIGSFYF